MELNNSRTKENLMRAFAGESMARNRYTFAAAAAKKFTAVAYSRQDGFELMWFMKIRWRSRRISNALAPGQNRR